ncbi:WD repeat-containing protein 67, partial [Eufriesea mexicana]
IKTLTLPENFIGVKYLSLVPLPLDGGASSIIACISSSCNLYFFDLNQSCIVNTLQAIKPIKKIAISSSGRYIAYIEKEGHLKLIITEKLFSEKCESLQKIKESHRPLAHGIHDHLQCVKQCIKHELRLKRLILILKEFGEYPEKYRILIWSTILNLPANKSAYNALANKVASINFTSDILKNYSLASRSKQILLMTTVHCLIEWCPLLIQCSFLPNIVFPFLIIFQKDLLLGFELILSIFLNYCQKWFEYHPLPPLNVLGIIENILLQADPFLLNTFCEYGITSSEYAWPLLNTAMSEVLSATEWLILWDHLISFKKPSLLLMCVVAYSICSREIIISSLQTQENIKKYFLKQGHIAAQELLKVAQQLDSDTPLRIHPNHYLRLKYETKAFMNQIHQMRLNEAEKCFKEYLSDINYELQREVQPRTNKIEHKHICDQFDDILHLDLDTPSDEDTIHSKNNKTKYHQLQQDVNNLEFEVQGFLNSLRSQKSKV